MVTAVFLSHLVCGAKDTEFEGEKKMVGATGFEPATSSSQTWRATRLRHAPTGPDGLSHAPCHRNPEMPRCLPPCQAAGTLRPRLAAMKPLDQCLLYAFVDSAYLDDRDPVELCRELCEGGADLVQLRAKDRPVDDIARLAKRLVPITAGAGVRLVINDHPQLAAEVGAPTAHLGQEDFFDAGHRHVDEVKPGGAALELGLSSHAPKQAVRACEAGADYVAIGPVFATPTKPGRPPVTLDYVRWAAANIDRPWFAIGGSDLDNLDDILAAGARRVCVVSALLRAPDVAGACRQFKERLHSAAR